MVLQLPNIVFALVSPNPKLLAIPCENSPLEHQNCRADHFPTSSDKKVYNLVDGILDKILPCSPAEETLCGPNICQIIILVGELITEMTSLHYSLSD